MPVTVAAQLIVPPVPTAVGAAGLVMAIDMPDEGVTVTVRLALLVPSAVLVAVKVQAPVDDPARTVQVVPVTLVSVPPPLRVQLTVLASTPV